MVTFTERAVAFLDVLGFTQLIKDSEATPSSMKLDGLITVLGSHVRFDNQTIDSDVPAEVRPKYIFISDSIIFSAPLEHGKYDGLDIVILKCIQIAQKLLESGHLVRGGISVGKVWQDSSNVFGSGYIDAYQTEINAKHPRIVLSPAALKIWQKASRSVPDLCIGDQTAQIVDILHPAYSRNNTVGLPFEFSFRQYRAHILQNLSTLPFGSEPRSKWEWMAGFFNDALERHQISGEPFDSIPVPI
jgi:hypothetical protein